MECKHTKTFIINSRPCDAYKKNAGVALTKRRHKCVECQHKFTTYELEESALSSLIDARDFAKKTLRVMEGQVSTLRGLLREQNEKAAPDGLLQQ